MQSLKQLMSKTPEPVVKRSTLTETWVDKVTIKESKELKTLLFEGRGKAQTEDPIYNVSVELYPTEVHKDIFKEPSLDNPAWVSCSCPYFLFNCEYALNKAGSSSIKYSNGEPPKKTNPKNVPFLCKHLYSIAPKVVKKALEMVKKDKEHKFEK